MLKLSEEVKGMVGKRVSRGDLLDLATKVEGLEHLNMALLQQILEMKAEKPTIRIP